MAYCKFQADQLFTGYELLDSTHVLITDTGGKVLNIIPASEAGGDVQQLAGIITPGFINCHCHLELSHLRNRIPSGTGLTGFIAAVMKSPPFSREEKDAAMEESDREMHQNGIAAVGDISNQPYSITQKIKSPLRWHSFLEITNLDDPLAAERLEKFQAIQTAFKNALPSMATTFSPHAIYSVSPETFRLINKHTAGQIITIHNQECFAEDELFIHGTGKFLSFYESIGRKQLPIVPSGKSSMQTWLPYFNQKQTIISVHNTYISEADIVFAKEYTAASNMQIVYCLCPNANMYIENRLPPVDLLMKHQCRIVLGTDSYGSNLQLSIGKEIETIQHHLPQTPLKDILQWATLNGAEALGFENELGSFEKGKQPGIVLIENGVTGSKRIL
ncbi:MAG: amidohydrolase family protein [Sphingobacteriales bacterium]|nr:amidohydrolase family protein [Sphingobacteriales bacterium]